MANGNSYEGEWKDDLPDGMGKQKMADGSVYEGMFRGGIKQGKGKYYFGEGMYEGQFKDDVFDGQGILLMNCGKYIKGTWRIGQLQGQGQMEWPSGQKYKGNFSHNQREGEGTYYFGDGREGNCMESGEETNKTDLDLTWL